MDKIKFWFVMFIRAEKDVARYSVLLQSLKCIESYFCLIDYLVEFHFIHSAMDISIDCTTNLKFQFLRLINFEILIHVLNFI